MHLWPKADWHPADTNSLLHVKPSSCQSDWPLWRWCQRDVLDCPKRKKTRWPVLIRLRQPNVCVETLEVRWPTTPARPLQTGRETRNVVRINESNMWQRHGRAEEEGTVPSLWPAWVSAPAGWWVHTTQMLGTHEDLHHHTHIWHLKYHSENQQNFSDWYQNL